MTMTITEQFDRLPPHSADAEMCMLASMMLDREICGRVLQVVTRGEACYSPDHQILFEAIQQLHVQGKPVDAVIVREQLAKRGQLEEIGGTSMIATVLSTVPSAAHGEHYARIVREKAILRAAIRVANDLLRDAYGPIGDRQPAEVLDQAAQRLIAIARNGGNTIIHRLGDVLAEIIAGDEQAVGKRYPTGLASLDKQIGGIRRGGNHLIAGKASMGKSALIKQFADNLSAGGVPVGIISVEESRYKIGENFLSNNSGVANHRIAFRKANAADHAEMVKAYQRLADRGVFIVDAARSLSEISAAAQQLVVQHKCEVIIVDHLHIVDGEVRDGSSREREISKISAGLKWLWKSLDVAGVSCAQLNRSSGSDRPTLSSLRDSGSLEQDADVVMLLHRQDFYRMGEIGYEPDNVLEIGVLKNKDGPAAIVPVHFDREHQRVTDREEELPI